MAPQFAVLSRVLESLESILQAPEAFISPDATLAASISAKVKHLYDFVKTNETQKEASSDALPELIVDGFDDEQVWQELELQNTHIIDFLIAEASRCVVKGGNGFETSLDTANDPGDQPKTTDDLLLAGDAVGDQSGTDNSEGSSEDGDGSDEVADHVDISGVDTEIKSSVVDDQFFKLAEMEKFLEQEDARFEREGKGEKDESDEEEEDMENDDEMANYMYDEFFMSKQASEKSNKKGVHWEDLETSENDDVSMDSEEETDSDELGDRNAMMKKVQDLLAESDDENHDDGDTLSKKTVAKSSFEKRMEKQKQKITELEKGSLADKPWQLLGEVSANQRPENSLLEEAVDFDVTTAPAPLVTQETTLKLEDLILQRIKDKAFDDVERKEKQVKEAVEYKKRVVLDQEKSKQSLSQIYEQEYLNKMASQESEQEVKEDPKHIEINKMMNALFAKLDALSNFNFTPRPAMPEIKIISNMPALTMEEATPVTATEASMLAPEEIRKPAAHLQSKAERSETDKKRERRRKKARGHAQRLAKLAREDDKLAAAAAAQAAKGTACSPSVAKLERKRALAALSKAEKGGGNVTVLKEQKQPGSGNKSYKSSAQFFQLLQEQTAIQVKKKRSTEHARTKEKQTIKKLKL